ncbi:MAG: hypothetical protein JNK99_03645, partial [Candidatus Accumulibacter sp.]|nr:hypothetical protein [Accumulibacter sp.]
MNVIVTIDGREAIPVRAVPFVTGWWMSPDVVASSLAYNDSLKRFEGIRACHLVDGSRCAEILPKEWDGVEDRLKGLESRLKGMSDDRALTRPIWLAESVPLLPPGTFLWKDEFERAFLRAYSPHNLLWIDERPGDRELNYQPLIPKDLKKAIFEGFGFDAGAYFDAIQQRQQSNFPHPEQEINRDDAQDEIPPSQDEIDAAIDFKAGFSETLLNGRSISWRYWLSFPRWTAQEASRLLCGLDPDRFKNLDEGSDQTAKARDRARNMERIAERSDVGNLAPEEWWDWARKHGFRFHKKLGLEIRRRGDHVKSAQSQDKDSEHEASATSSMDRGDPDMQVSRETPGTSRRPLLQQLFQEEEILRVLRKLGYDPRQLPKPAPGCRGPKAACRNALKFPTKVFLISNDRQPGALGEPGEAYPALCHHREHRHGHESNSVSTRFVDAGVH